MYSKLIYTVCVFFLDGKQVGAHKCILVSSSEYFRAMFCGDFSEGQQGQRPVALPTVVEEDLATILLAVYGGKLLLTAANMFGVLVASHQFDLQVGLYHLMCLC